MANNGDAERGDKTNGVREHDWDFEAERKCGNAKVHQRCKQANGPKT